MTRVCNICEIEKDKIDFNLTKEGKYKYKCCKSCFSLKRKDSTKEYYEKNKDKINAYSKKYNEENKEILYTKHTNFQPLYWLDNLQKSNKIES